MQPGATSLRAMFVFLSEERDMKFVQKSSLAGHVESFTFCLAFLVLE